MTVIEDYQRERVEALEHGQDTMEEIAVHLRSVILHTSPFVGAATLEELSKTLRQIEALERVMRAAAKLHRSHYQMPARESAPKVDP